MLFVHCATPVSLSCPDPDMGPFAAVLAGSAPAVATAKIRVDHRLGLGHYETLLLL